MTGERPETASPRPALRAAPLPPALDRGALLPRDAWARATERRCDVLVVGSGIAGLVAAIECSAAADVLLVTKRSLGETNTWLAQGGIAGAVGEADSVELHVADTLVVGQGLCEDAVVRTVLAEAPAALRVLDTLGVGFDRDAQGGIELAREGGHSLPRVLHSGDATGAAIQDALLAAVRDLPRVELSEERFLVDLTVEDGRCTGALLMDVPSGRLERVRAGAVVLATGGCGQAFRVTTNPLLATGDGVAAAWRAGADLADMEFVQFHPTALDAGASPEFLITEALRGEGAYLLDCEEKRFMPGVHPLAELAPRDVVSREIESVMARCGRPNVWLDARHLEADYLRRRFPTIWEACAHAGFDLSRDLVPVAPAAHYMIGGVRVDIDGRTSLPGLYGSGEVVSSGLHGANRLASNSLLEGLVLSRRIARALSSPWRRSAPRPAEGEIAAAPAGEVIDPAATRIAVQELMSSLAGMTRTGEGLAQAAVRLDALASASLPEDPSVAALEAVNLLTLSSLVVRAAYVREESRGVHFRADAPERDDARWHAHLVWRRGEEPRTVPVGTY